MSYDTIIPAKIEERLKKDKKEKGEAEAPPKEEKEEYIYFVPVSATPFKYSVCPLEMICDASPEKLVT